MEHITYKPIQTIKKTDKAEVIFAAMEEYDEPVIIKRIFGVNASLYEVISTLHNSHIPKIYAIEEHSEELLVAEEYIDGKTLTEYLDEEHVSDAAVLELMRQLCEAIEVLHQCKPAIIHRDIKPSNILVDKHGVVKIIDFDASRQYKQKSTNDTRLLGTVEYAAPEQFGYAQTDARSDIYSLGVVFSEITFSEKFACGKEWKRLTDRCTSFDPANRYATVRQLMQDVEKCIFREKHAGWRKIVKTATVIIGVFLLTTAVVWILHRENKVPVDENGNGTEQQGQELPDTPTPKWMADYTSVEEYLEAMQVTVLHYYQGMENARAVLWQPERGAEQKIKEYSVTAEKISDGSKVIFEKRDMLSDGEVLILGSNCFESLEPTYYHLQFVSEGADSGGECYLQIHGAEETVIAPESILLQNRIDWNMETENLIVLLRPEVKGGIEKLYLCRQQQQEDSFAEVLTALEEEDRELLVDGRGVRLTKRFCEKYAVSSDFMLYLECSDGNGERVQVFVIK